MLWKDPCFKIEVNDELPNPCSGPKWRYQWVIGHYNKGHKNGFLRRGQNWVKNQVAPRQILHQLFSGHCSLSTGGTAQISFYYVREFLLVDHSSSLNKVIHTESYCTDVLHMKWQSTGQDPEELDILMNQFYVQPLFQHCLGLLVLKISQTENLCQVTSLIGVRDRTCQNISSGFLPNQTHDFKQTFNMWQYICQNIYHLYAHIAVLECSGNPTINARGKKD